MIKLRIVRLRLMVCKILTVIVLLKVRWENMQFVPSIIIVFLPKNECSLFPVLWIKCHSHLNLLIISRYKTIYWQYIIRRMLSWIQKLSIQFLEKLQFLEKDTLFDDFFVSSMFVCSSNFKLIIVDSIHRPLLIIRAINFPHLKPFFLHYILAKILL